MQTSHPAIKICQELQKQGYPTYLVGGAVRDFLSPKKEKVSADVDLATAAKPQIVKRSLKKLGMRFFAVGEKFGTIAALTKEGNVEITTFRKETGYSDQRHPDKVVFNATVEEDSNRRDFTIGAIYLNPRSGEVLDFHAGKKDLKAKMIRFVNDPERRIKEDPLRMLRAVRFAVTLNFKIATKDFKAIEKNAKLVSKVSRERIKKELDAILESKNNVSGIELLSKLNLLKYFLPELENLKKVSQSKDFHNEGNAFIHSLLALQKMSEQGSGKEFFALMYAALLHDIGKISTAKKVLRDGRPHISFHGHAPRGAEMFKAIAKRLAFSTADTKRIHYLIQHHMDILEASQLSEKTLVKLRKNIYFKDLLYLRIADSSASIMTNKSGKIIKRDLSGIKKLLKLADVVSVVKTKKLISGNDVMRVLKMKEGKKVGKVLEHIFNLQISGKVKTKKDALNVLKSLDNFT